MDRLGARPVALVDRGVPDDPLMVDRVVVAEDDREGPPGADRDGCGRVVRVTYRDLRPIRSVAGHCRPGCGDPREADRERDAAGQGETARPAMSVHRGDPLRPST